MSEARTSLTKDEEAIKKQRLENVEKAWKAINAKFYNESDEQDEQVQSAPTMVFSVIGDSDSFAPRPWPKTVFQTALIEAAKSGGETWILFRGNRSGVSKIIRDAYHYYGVMELGIDSMETSIDHVNRHVKLISIAGKKESRLVSDQCYTVNDGEGDNFLLDFETFVSEQMVHLFGRPMGLKMPVPIAIIVCEGDIKTISHVSGSLKKNLPVIIMKGSGKAADFILDFLEYTSVRPFPVQRKKTLTPRDLKNGDDLNNQTLWDDSSIEVKGFLKTKPGILFGVSVNESEYKTLEDCLRSISEKKDLIRVFDLDHDDPLMLSSIIGEAVVGCWSMEGIFHNQNHEFIHKEEEKIKGNQAQVHQTGTPTGKQTSSPRINQKSINVVFPQPEKKHDQQEGHIEFRQYVFDPQFSTPTSLPLSFFFGYQILHERKEWEERGHLLLLEALKENRCDYVRVLLDQDVDIKKLDFAELYEQTVACKECSFKRKDCLHMQWLLKQNEKSSAKKLCHKYRNQMKKQKPKHEKEEKLRKITLYVPEAARNLCCKILDHKGNKSENVNISDILLWAIFANRRELAEICWLKGNDHLMTGLLSSAILLKLSDDADDVKEHSLTIDLREHSRLFEQRCLTLMDKMSDENRENAIELMETIVDVWGISSSPLTFAYENKICNVVAHPCSQKSVRKQWYNDLAPDLCPFLKSCWKNKREFITAPVTRYLLNYILFLTMLIMYSAFVLTSVSTKYYEQNQGRIYEYYVYFWGAGDFIEEVLCCFGVLESKKRSHRGYCTRLKRYFCNLWNWWDILSYVLLILALFVRHFYIDETFTIARRLFALSLLVMYPKFLGVFLMFRKIGLTIIMMGEMLKDLINFLVVAFFVVVGVGIYYHANLWPDDQSMWSGDWTDWRIWTILYYPYWQLYAEINMDILKGKDPENCTFERYVWETDPSHNRCTEADWTVQGIAAIYLLFSNLLLVNLVIAKFSYTFEKVLENSEKIWHFEKYRALADYEWRIPSPINIFLLPCRLIFHFRKENCCCQSKQDKKKEEQKEKKKILLRDFQKIIALKMYDKL